MKIPIAPSGKAGTDVLYQIAETIQSHLERMFQQGAKRSALNFGVGRLGRSDRSDDIIRFDAQERECDAAITFHAGRALDLALQLVYAKITDRIFGREYPNPGIEEREIVRRDRITHKLSCLYERILDDFIQHNDLDTDELASALEYVYQKAWNQGIVDLTIDDKSRPYILYPENYPFRKKCDNSMTDGVERTNHTGQFGQFALSVSYEYSFGTFREFLQTADQSYYLTNDMRYNDYAFRDHEGFKPYDVAGMDFFARLVKGLVSLSHQPPLWNKDFAERLYQYKVENIKCLVETLGHQFFKEELNLPEMKSPQDHLNPITSASLALDSPDNRSSWRCKIDLT